MSNWSFDTTVGSVIFSAAFRSTSNSWVAMPTARSARLRFPLPLKSSRQRAPEAFGAEEAPATAEVACAAEAFGTAEPLEEAARAAAGSQSESVTPAGSASESVTAPRAS
eukprot:251978-Lingulodinium_polyedra.AAC.1